jgi:hypothetical protein
MPPKRVTRSKSVVSQKSAKKPTTRAKSAGKSVGTQTNLKGIINDNIIEFKDVDVSKDLKKLKKAFIQNAKQAVSRRVLVISEAKKATKRKASGSRDRVEPRYQMNGEPVRRSERLASKPRLNYYEGSSESINKRASSRTRAIKKVTEKRPVDQLNDRKQSKSTRPVKIPRKNEAQRKERVKSREEEHEEAEVETEIQPNGKNAEQRDNEIRIDERFVTRRNKKTAEKAKMGRARKNASYANLLSVIEEEDEHEE